jgi:hypothetical protein
VFRRESFDRAQSSSDALLSDVLREALKSIFVLERSWGSGCHHFHLLIQIALLIHHIGGAHFLSPFARGDERERVREENGVTERGGGNPPAGPEGSPPHI